MKTHFDEYLTSVKDVDLHPKLNSIIAKLPDELHKLPNLIIYGPKGVGKYTQTLKILKKYSPSGLKYDKKFSLLFNKQNINYKISDIHYEIDMSTLGCNAKSLWHDLYTQLIDIISAKNHKCGIIVCKHFHEIHSDLLDIFYSYMQKNHLLNINISFILITEHISFISDNILNSSQIIHIGRPTKCSYEKLSKCKLTNIKSSDINNIMDLEYGLENIIPHKHICNKVLNYINDLSNLDMIKCREILYELLIYNLNIYDCVWYIIEQVSQNYNLSNNDISDIISNSYLFFKYYNNNYRPIFHLEKYIYYITCKIHNINLSTNYLDIL